MVARTEAAFIVELRTSAEIESLADEITSKKTRRPRKLPLDQIPRLKEIRRQRAAIPTDQQLADELGVSVRTIQEAMK